MHDNGRYGVMMAELVVEASMVYLLVEPASLVVIPWRRSWSERLKSSLSRVRVQFVLVSFSQLRKAQLKSLARSRFLIDVWIAV